ncbi:LPXTG cell wall anchor domain-containing protein [uncultured Granulicatella sp.]|uniref:LPXTG cell wall anchor domain-containing protein n=1 Tax=uncultured Granulicatella sp. TaxID=316089 RepID=UPI0028D31812|nr:LPXTG cell wall anchor domain-containing protein [uncultured Granulicatella sp.]
MIKKLLLSAIFLTTVLFSGLNHSIYAQVANTVELETLNQGQVKNIIRVNSEDELPTDGTTYTLVYSKQHCKLTDEIEKTSEATQKKTIESAPQTTTLTTVLKAQAKQSLPQTGTQQSLTIVLTAGVLVALAFLMIKYHKKKVWMVLLITASVTSLYNLRNVMAENETKITTIPVTTFVPTSDHCLYGYIIIPNTSETTKFETTKGESLVYEKPEFKGEVPRMPEAHKKAEVLSEKGEPLVQPELPEYEVPTTTTAGTSTEATVTTATTTTSTEPTTTTASAVTIAESNVEASSDNAKPTTEAISNTNTSNNE